MSKEKNDSWWRVLVNSDPTIVCSYAGRFIGQIEDEIKKSQKDGYERGITFCTDEETGEVSSTKSCTGDECSVTSPKCKTGEKRIGGFHVHPSESLEPSMADINYALYYKLRFSCIGTTTETQKETSPGVHVVVPETAIKCSAYDIDNPDYKRVVNDITPILEEAAEYGNKLVKKTVKEGEILTSDEWGKYQGMKKEVMDKLRISNLYYDSCPIITTVFETVKRTQIEAYEGN